MTASLGFTGTKAGMSAEQAVAVLQLLIGYKPKEVHHGNCIGSDEQFDWLVRQFFPSVLIHVHPANELKYQSNCHTLPGVIHPSKPYLVRDQDIVDASSVVIATPLTEREVLRSGTWATIRKARNQSTTTNLYVIGPNGQFVETHRKPLTVT